MASTSTSIASHVAAAVSDWSGVTVHDHRFGGHEFRLGAREIGHLHDDHQVDIAYPRPVRDAVVAAGLAGPHHLFPDSGWVTYRVDEAAGAADDSGAADRIVELLRLSYLVHVAALVRRGDRPELEGFDVVAELDGLDLAPDVTAVVRARLA